MLDIIHTMVAQHPYWMMLISFGLAMLADIVWAKWHLAIQNKESVCAANWSVLIYLFGIVYTLVIIEKDLKQIVAYIAGAWLGTYLTVLNTKGKEQ